MHCFIRNVEVHKWIKSFSNAMFGFAKRSYVVSVWRGFLCGWSGLFYFGTPRAFHIIILKYPALDTKMGNNNTRTDQIEDIRVTDGIVLAKRTAAGVVPYGSHEKSTCT